MTDATTEAALRDMSRSIGGLESTVKSLVQTWQVQEASASQGRRDLHQKFDVLSEKMLGLSAKVDTVIRDVTEIKPSVEAFETARERAAGAWQLGKWVWGVFGFVGGVGGWALLNWSKFPLH